MKITHVHPVSAKQPCVDPVCGMEIDPASPYQIQHTGQTYFFCSEHCLHKFKANPAQYRKESSAEPADESQGITYTCPMHPEMRYGAGT